MKHPLDEELNLPPSSEVGDIFGMNLTLPDNPNMTTVVNLALQQYKNLVESAMILEPESQVEILSLAREFLNLAKDTMYRESDLAIKSQRVAVQRERGGGGASAPLGSEDEQSSDKSLTYDQVLDEISKERKKKKPR